MDDDGIGGCDDSNLTGGFAMREAMEGCVLAGECFDGADFISRPGGLSDVYMTATLVEGEFIVPVSDQPIAIEKSVAFSITFLPTYLDLRSPWVNQVWSGFWHLF